MNRNYETLDAIAVIGSLAIVAGIVVGLFAFTLDPAVAPIVASLATAILGLPVSYGAFRWGNSVGAKSAADSAAKVSEKSADALATLAGVTPAKVPENAKEAADRVADAADEEAGRITGGN